MFLFFLKHWKSQVFVFIFFFFVYENDSPSFFFLVFCNRDLSWQSLSEHDQYWRFAGIWFLLFFFIGKCLFLSVFLSIIWTKKRRESERYLPTFNYSTASSREREVSTKQVSQFLFNGAYLINMLNRFNIDRTRSKWCRKRMCNSIQWKLTNKPKTHIILNFGLLDLFHNLNLHCILQKLMNFLPLIFKQLTFIILIIKNRYSFFKVLQRSFVIS